MRSSTLESSASPSAPFGVVRLATTMVLAWMLGVACVAAAFAQAPEDYAPDRVEPGSIEKIREYTTAPEYLPRSVAYVPESETVPSPTKVLGHVVGAPDVLSSVATIHDYFRKLAAASDCVRVETIGTSEEGREMLLVTVSSPENLAKLDHYRDVMSRLADPRTTTRQEMTALVADCKPSYYLMGGLHSTETGSPEMLMELAYRLAVSERPEIRAIRDGLVVLITPVVEVDGRDRVVQWYDRHLRNRSLPYEELEQFDSPPYWGHYAFHDNNRDGMQLTLALTRTVNDTYYRFHPLVMHDLHESVPLLYISTGHGPYTQAADPITVNEWTQFAYHEAAALQAQGLPGVWTWAFWDGWWPGYLFSVANNHNSTGRFYETFGNGVAGTYERKLDKSRFAGKPVTEVQWYRPWPPDKKLMWSLRNNTNYMESGVLAALGYATLHGQELLENFYAKGERAIENGATEAPYAWIFAREQHDPARLRYLLRQLLAHKIEVRTLQDSFQVGDTKYPAGSWIVRLDQPYRNAAVTFLDVQEFPADEPNPPYDDIAWTWPLLDDVSADRIDDAAILDAPVSEPVASIADVPGSIRGSGSIYLLRDTGQTALATARVLLGKNSVQAADTAFAAADTTFPAGSWILRAPRKDVEDVASKLGLDFDAVAGVPEVARHAIGIPRIGVLHTWVSTQDCGWVRYTLDRAQVPYTLISDDDVRRGKLRSRFDVILFPNSWGDFATLVHGIDPKYGPLAYTRTAQYPSHGIPDSSPDITGGMGLQGVIELQRFVEAGGLLAAIGNAGTLVVDGGITRDVEHAVPGTMRTPGSELRATVQRPLHPVVYGYERRTSVFRGSGPLWDVEDRNRGLVVLQFGTKKVPADDEDEKAGAKPATSAGGQGMETAMAGSPGAAAGARSESKATAGDGKNKGHDELVLSGYVQAKDKLDGAPAILDVPVGKGHVLLFAFNPMHRYLNHSDFRFVYNAILNWDDLPPTPRE
jgi:Zinc carboxypeptidase